MSKTKEITVEVWSYTEYYEAIASGDKLPSKYHFRNGLGDYTFIKTTKRQIAQEYIDMHHEGIYNLICNGIEKSNKPQTAFGTATRKGQKKYN